MKVEIPKYSSFSIVGAARSGVAVAKLLKSKGYEVFLSDSAAEETINKGYLTEIRHCAIPFEFGRHSNKVYESELVIVSPGVSQNSEVVRKSLELGREVVSEIEVASWFCKGKIISITGTNGKTTTTTLIGEIFKNAGYQAYVCGNIGTAFADVVDKIDTDDVAIVETSSFQLDNIKKFKPHASVLLNITPDHLDRYEHEYQKYIDSKLKVTMNQTEKDYFIYDYDDEIIRQNLSEEIKAKRIPFSIRTDLSSEYVNSAFLRNNKIVCMLDKVEENIIDIRRLIIKGHHNIYNSLASVIASKIFNIKKEIINTTLSEFKGVEHRLEFVRDLNGVKFYNDSKATNVNSAWYALQGFTQPIILILGGRDKGNDYSEIVNEVRKFVKHIIAVGESKNKVSDFFNKIVPVSVAGDFMEAVNIAYSKAERNEIVLLSPACASFDMFENYEHRGREFKRIVNELK